MTISYSVIPTGAQGVVEPGGPSATPGMTVLSLCHSDRSAAEWRNPQDRVKKRRWRLDESTTVPTQRLRFLLLQKLPGGYVRTYLNRYRHQTFYRFQDGSLETRLTVMPGVWACGVRFVNTLTGQATPVAECGRVSALPS